MTFFNQVQSIQILYLCKSITEAAWKYSCKSPDSSIFDGREGLIRQEGEDPEWDEKKENMCACNYLSPIYFTQFSSVWGHGCNSPNHESKEAVPTSNLSLTWSLNYKGKKILWFIFHIALLQLSGQEVTWQVISPISQPRVYQSSYEHIPRKEAGPVASDQSETWTGLPLSDWF